MVVTNEIEHESLVMVLKKKIKNGFVITDQSFVFLRSETLFSLKAMLSRSEYFVQRRDPHIMILIVMKYEYKQTNH